MNQNKLGSSLVLIVTTAIKKFHPLSHKSLLLILTRFLGTMSHCAIVCFEKLNSISSAEVLHTTVYDYYHKIKIII